MGKLTHFRLGHRFNFAKCNKLPEGSRLEDLSKIAMDAHQLIQKWRGNWSTSSEVRWSTNTLVTLWSNVAHDRKPATYSVVYSRCSFTIHLHLYNIVDPYLYFVDVESLNLHWHPGCPTLKTSMVDFHLPRATGHFSQTSPPRCSLAQSIGIPDSCCHGLWCKLEGANLQCGAPKSFKLRFIIPSTKYSYKYHRP